MMSNFYNTCILIGYVKKVIPISNGAYMALDSDPRENHQCLHFIKFAKDLAARLVNVQPKQKVMLTVHLESKLAANKQSIRISTIADQLQLLN